MDCPSRGHWLVADASAGRRRSGATMAVVMKARLVLRDGRAMLTLTLTGSGKARVEEVRFVL